MLSKSQWVDTEHCWARRLDSGKMICNSNFPPQNACVMGIAEGNYKKEVKWEIKISKQSRNGI